MSYVAPTSKGSGVLIDAATWNQDVKDNIIALHSPPAARAYHNTTQTIVTGGGGDTILLNSERYDTDTIHDTSTNNSRLTCQTAGVYLFTGTIRMDSNDGGAEIQLRVFKGAGGLLTAQQKQSLSGGNVILSVAGICLLAVDDYIEMNVYHNSTLNKTLQNATAYANEFTMTWIGEGV